MEFSRDHGDLCSTRAPRPHASPGSPAPETAHSRSPWCRPASPHPSSLSLQVPVQAEGAGPRDPHPHPHPAVGSRAGRARLCPCAPWSSCAVCRAHPDTPCLQGSPNSSALGVPPERRERPRTSRGDLRGPSPPAAPLPSGIGEGQAPAAARPLPRQANNTPKWAPALPLKMDVDRPQCPAWARGWRRQSALCAQRPRAVAGLLFAQRLSGAHAVAPGPSCCRQSPRKQRPVCYLLWPEGLTAVLQSCPGPRAGSSPPRRTRWPPAFPAAASSPWLPSSWTGEARGRAVLSRSPQCRPGVAVS